jgi:hypothetical protein
VLEARAYAEGQPCPNCGEPASLSQSHAAKPTDGGVWEVGVDCYLCGSILRYLFDAAPEWATRSTEDPNMMAKRFAPAPSTSALFNKNDLRRLIDDTLPLLNKLEAERAASPKPPPELLHRKIAHWGLRASRALREMQAQDIALSDEDHALLARLEANEAAIKA